MFVHNINPIIFSIGPLSVRWYSLAYVLGFLAAYWWLHYLTKRKTIKNLTPKRVESYMLYLILAVIISGRLFEFVFFRPEVWLTDPLEVLRIWHGGMSFHGGLVGVAAVTWWFCKKHDISLLELGDALSLPAAISLFLGRIANFINAELVGKLTSVRWCVEFPGYEGCRHPSQLYEAGKNLVIFGTLAFAWKWRGRRPGTIMWLFIALYGLLRMAVNVWRDDPVFLIGLSMGQFLSMLMFFVGTGGLLFLYRNTKKY
ncbi:prolipoprotein diacylglyceryl transferase [Candidatus Woesearchaeota archaeon]|nr:prolipoprotein diacylglyceryl transferase [Candidatus Woesearchaeota archaeon]